MIASTMLSLAAALGALGALGALAPSPATAGSVNGAVVLRGLDLPATSPAGARRTLARIEQAALAACGAPPGALREVRRATRKSACWKESVARAVGEVNDPLLTRVHRDSL